MVSHGILCPILGYYGNHRMIIAGIASIWQNFNACTAEHRAYWVPESLKHVIYFCLLGPSTNVRWTYKYAQLCQTSELYIKLKRKIGYLECGMKVRTSFSKLKIMRTAIRNSNKKCGVLGDQCLSYKKAYIDYFPGDWPECIGSLISIGTLKKKCPKFNLSKLFYSTLHYFLVYDGSQRYFI